MLQASFLRAVEHRKHFANVQSPIAYLFQIARNEAARNQSRTKAERTEQLSIEQAIQARTTSTEQSEMMDAALDRLAPDDREIVELKIDASLTFEEIAQVMNRSAATVATRYRRALEALRPWLERQFR